MGSMPFSLRGGAFRVLTLFLISVLLAGTAAGQSFRSDAQEIDRLVTLSKYRNAIWGIVVVDLENGRTLYSRNPDKSLVPASNAKIYTTAAALEQLGPAWRYRTELYREGPIRDGVLLGNLVVRGAGDPTIGGRPDTLDQLKVFKSWADSLRAAGISRIEGDIVGDDDYFDDVPLGLGWSWDDEPYWYAAEISALTFSENTVDFAIQSTTPGRRATVTWEPLETDYVSVSNETLTTARGGSIREGYARTHGANEIRLYSRVPAGQTDLESLSVSNPTTYFVHVLRETLERAGIRVSGHAMDVDSVLEKPDYRSFRLQRLATHTSPELRDIVKVLNKESHNLYAEMLLKTLGAERRRDDSEYASGTAEAGIEAAETTFRRAGVDFDKLYLVDGSGLSRMDLVTAASNANLLRYVWQHPNRLVRNAFYDSLPVGGVDGSLDKRFTSGPARGNVHAKTGTFRGASSLSGYVRTSSDRPLAFAIICNNYTTSTATVRATQDAIVNILARSSY